VLSVEKNGNCYHNGKLANTALGLLFTVLLRERERERERERVTHKPEALNPVSL
jgi:hypothetical protein